MSKFQSVNSAGDSSKIEAEKQQRVSNPNAAGDKKAPEAGTSEASSGTRPKKD